MKAVPNAAHTAAYKIFHYPFRIWIPQLYLTSLAENRALGSYTSGNSKLDREQSRQPVAIAATIARMIEFYQRGISIEFDNLADCVRIYDTILEHINDFQKHIVESTWMAKEVPWDDLKVMDEFAGEVFFKARGRIATREATTHALRSLESRCASFVKFDLFGNKPETMEQEIAASVHKQRVEEIRTVFDGRHKTWR